MIYPKCLYKTREITKVAQDEKEHMLLASAGWKDIWTDEKPHEFEVIKEIKETKDMLEFYEKEEETIIKDKPKRKRPTRKKKVNNGNGK